LRPGNRLLIIGGGFIGLEVAAAARGRACSVVIAEAQSRILMRSVSEYAASHIAELHAAHGATIKTGCTVAEATDLGDGLEYHFSDGTPGIADLVLLGVGNLPNVELAREAGISLCSQTGGILVDRHCQTSHANIYAIGDVASEFHPLLSRTVRLQ